MSKKCSGCQQAGPLHSSDDVKAWTLDMGISDSRVEQMTEEDGLCAKCYGKVLCRHAVVVYNHFEQALMPDEFEDVLKGGHDWVAIAKAEMGSPATGPTQTALRSPSPSPSRHRDPLQCGQENHNA